jgi:DNA polymerase III delta prime subunit
MNMQEILDNYKRTGRLHHAYVLYGDKKIIKNSLFTFLEQELDFPIIHNPDLWQGEYNVFKIKDSHALNTEHLKQPLLNNKKVFILFLNAITLDAQNSLLKIFEEPKAESVFFIICPAGINLLPTLKSRLISQSFAEDNIFSSVAKKFLQSNISERMGLISKLTKEVKDEKKVKADMISLLKEIENIVAKQKDRNTEQIYCLEKAISYSNDESASVKMILEHLATTV